ncbi:MAG: histidinol dehydrogenase, partial [Clostridiales bacterium]|nr:histidinol dehydrogenase [Clostridiales bacterium]
IYNGEKAEALFGAREEASDKAEQTVKAIISNVRDRGDAALREYSAKFDGYTGAELEVTQAESDRAEREVAPEFKETLLRAADNIRAFHARQKRDGFELNTDGRIVGQKVIPLARAAIYVPGGTAAYPSTVLMNAIPAKIAGVGEVIMATPVKADGKVKPEVLAAARVCGVDRVFKMGGAQAIAALAYGTESVPKVDKITGPGNIFVATAKRLVAGVACGIDMIAGPSEILVVADGGANAEHVAADLLSQAEHDALASAVLICDDVKFAERVISFMYRRLERLPRREIATASVENNCKVIITDSVATAVGLADEYAPEHLELCVKDPFALLDKVRNAGSVFLGYNTPEAVGDYFAGANHTLPTNGTARFSSPLGVEDFVKTTQYIYY